MTAWPLATVLPLNVQLEAAATEHVARLFAELPLRVPFEHVRAPATEVQLEPYATELAE